jgi:hypothetical protein
MTDTLLCNIFLHELSFNGVLLGVLKRFFFLPPIFCLSSSLLLFVELNVKQGDVLRWLGLADIESSE